MVSSFAGVNNYLNALSAQSSVHDTKLATVHDALALLGNPQNTIPAIHIAGTSGKGSTAYYASSLLQNMGYRVGMVVSPHLQSVAERAQINGAPLDEITYCRLFSEFISLSEKHQWKLTYIEFLTIFAYWLFAQERVDYMVIEVGVGGRLDPTNVITRSHTVRVITDIGFDHMELLGNTIAEIASEKAGIIHSSDTVVLHQQPSEVMDVIAASCRQLSAQQIVADSAIILGSPLPLFQQRNWTLAHRAVNERLIVDGQLALSKQASALSQQINIPGRFEHITSSGIDIILDVAHNAQKLTALTSSIAARPPSIAPVYVVAFGGNKQAILSEILAVISQNASAIIATNFPSTTTAWYPSLAPKLIAKAWPTSAAARVTIITDPLLALEKAIHIAKEQHTIVVVTGSFYLIEGVRAKLLDTVT